MSDTDCKLRKLVDFIRCIVIKKRSGHLEINFSQGSLTKAYFKELLDLEK